MQLKSFFTKQRFIILGFGVVFFIAFITLANHFGHDTETGVLFIDLAGSAVTIIATALVIELLQYREQAERTHQVATIAEEEIQTIGYRVKHTIVSLYGFAADKQRQEKLGSLNDVESFLKNSSRAIDSFYKDSRFKRPSESAVQRFRDDCRSLEHEIQNVITLFGYALPYTLRTYVLALRSNLQISERSLGLIDISNGINDNNQKLLRELSSAIYKSADKVLNHESRTSDDQTIARKPGRVSKQGSAQ